MKMNNVLSVAFLAAGVYVLSMWITVSRGHVFFRPDKVEDWIISGMVLLAFGLSFFFFIKNQKDT